MENQFLKAEVNLIYDLHVPEITPAPLLIATHGYGENSRHMMRIAKQCAPDNLAVASLQGLYQQIQAPREEGGPLKFGFGWLTNFRPEESIALHHKFILDVIEKLTDDKIIDADKIFLLGFSQTCAMNFRFALTHRNILKGVFGLCGGVPGDLETSELFADIETPAFYLYGDDDKYVTTEKFAENAARLKARVRILQTKQYAAKHEITAEMRTDVQSRLSELDS